MTVPGTGAYQAVVDGARVAYRGSPPLVPAAAPASPVVRTAPPPPPPIAAPRVIIAPPPQPKIDPPPGVAVIQGQPDGSYVVSPLPPGLPGDDAGQINYACLEAQQQGADSAAGQNIGARVVLAYGTFNLQSEVVVPATVSLQGQGAGSRLMMNFSGTGVYHHRTAGYGTQYGQPNQQSCGFLRDFVIDMASAGPGSIGLDVGDGWGHYVDIEVVNGTSQPGVTFSSVTNAFSLPVGQNLPNGYPVMLLSGTMPTGFAGGKVYYVINSLLNTFQLSTTPGGGPVVGSTNGANLTVNGCVGLYAVSRVFWSEKGWYRAQLKHNAIAAIIDTQVSANDYSHEYNWFLFDGLFCDTGQQGIVVASGSNLGGSRMWIEGNMSVTSSTGSNPPPGNIAMLTLTGTNLKNGDGSRLYQGQLWTKVEGNPGNGSGTVFPYGVYSDGNGYVREVSGQIAHSLGNPNVAGLDSQINGAEFGFRGPCSGDSYLTQIYPTGTGGTTTAQPAFPGFGPSNPMKNTGPDQLVTVQGGTITSISLNGQSLGAGVTSCVGLSVPSGASLTMAGTVAPTTYQWVNVAQNAY